MNTFVCARRWRIGTLQLLVSGLLLGWFCYSQPLAQQKSTKQAPPNYKTIPFSGLKVLADKGDPIAQNEVGLAFALGTKGQRQDFEQAFKLFSQAAEQGNSSAQHNLASLFFYGNGVPKNYQEALKWYRKSAEQGFIPAQFFLGWMYSEGKGVDENFKEALKWFKKAADQRDPEAEYSLGLMYLKGEDLNPDYVEAYKWINLAAAQGNTNAIRFRGKLSVSMTQEQIADGQRRASDFVKSKPSTNESPSVSTTTQREPGTK